MPAYAAFLRAINVGGKRRVPMKDLAALLEGMGCKDVRTYLQSGNVVFTSTSKEAALEKKIEHAIAEKFGFEVPVTLRTAEEMQAVVKASPHAGKHPQEWLHVAFLKAAPDVKADWLHAKCAPGDDLKLHGRELYLYLPAGVGNSKLTNVYLDKQLGTMSTLRNWNTVMAVTSLLTA